LPLLPPPALPLAAQPDSISQQISKGCVLLAVGLPGSGKTSWFRRQGVTPLSGEMLPGSLFEGITGWRHERRVLSTLRQMLRERLAAKEPLNYVDATNLSPSQRQEWIKIAMKSGYEAHAVFFDVPLEVCLERNRRRGSKVSSNALSKMATRLQPPTLDEGFTKITTVRIKKKQSSKSKEANDSASC
jgi:predicted kinase